MYPGLQHSFITSLACLHPFNNGEEINCLFDWLWCETCLIGSDSYVFILIKRQKNKSPVRRPDILVDESYRFSHAAWNLQKYSKYFALQVRKEHLCCCCIIRLLLTHIFCSFHGKLWPWCDYETYFGQMLVLHKIKRAGLYVHLFISL